MRIDDLYAKIKNYRESQTDVNKYDFYGEEDEGEE